MEDDVMGMALITIISILVGYYSAILLHEWGHGTVAWLFGYKGTPFDIDYDGGFLIGVDEHVPYDQILAAGQGWEGALIGIAGVTVSIILFVLSATLLRRIQRGWLYSFVYWFAIWNMVPQIQYLTVQAFSTTGDTGRFVVGLGISPWWVVVPGVIYLCFALREILVKMIPKAYATIPIKNIWIRCLFLLVTLAVMFLLIYGNNYNPLSDRGMPFDAKVFAILLLFVPVILFFVSFSSVRRG